MDCPTCKGKGEVFGHTNTGQDSSNHHWGSTTCHRCKGSGSVPDEMEQWIEEGKRAAAKRCASGETLFQKANRLGISCAELSAMESGIKPFSEDHK